MEFTNSARDTAAVTGRRSGRGWHGQQHSDYQARFLSVWVRQQGAWRNVAYQPTPIK
ncbi:MAG TPA: hypothetical protein VK879_00490 [Candidatus Sulfomarinibacteraceae bacterium]|nr:hypothetical protein [Candidatus Sulfomarinibacteraceae bacterium]